jgi:hypothetical protein
MKIKVDRKQRVYYYLDEDGEEIDVPAEKVKEYKRIYQEFSKMQEEIRTLVDTKNIHALMELLNIKKVDIKEIKRGGKK